MLFTYQIVLWRNLWQTLPIPQLLPNPQNHSSALSLSSASLWNRSLPKKTYNENEECSQSVHQRVPPSDCSYYSSLNAHYARLAWSPFPSNSLLVASYACFDCLWIVVHKDPFWTLVLGTILLVGGGCQYTFICLSVMRAFLPLGNNSQNRYGTFFFVWPSESSEL